MTQVPKPSRTVDRKFLNSHHEMRCLVCGRHGSDPAHIQSVGAGGGDAPDNVVPLCRRCHSEQHQCGWIQFAIRYPIVMGSLTKKGWAVRDGRLRRK